LDVLIRMIERSLVYPIPSRERGDWRVRVEARIELRCTADSFLVRQSLAAFEGETRLFARDWDREIARDLV
jgi:hypothetical protein